MNDKCFALRARSTCSALRGNCPGCAACAFYKPKRQQEAEQRRANARLRRLPLETMVNSSKQIVLNSERNTL